MASKDGPRTTCGSRVVVPRRWRGRGVAAEAVYVRYSPDRAARDYLHRGERVELVCHGPRWFDGVLVRERGVAGLVEGAALQRS
jgi:hypothetical protein